MIFVITGEAREVVPFAEKKLDGDKLKAFITAEKMPLTIEFNSGNSDKIFNSGINKQVRCGLSCRVL